VSFRIEPLPYSTDALAPALSQETLELHYGKHHLGYLEKLNKLTAGRPEANATLEELIASATGDVFNNAAQVWNHSFYWRCMRPHGGGVPRPELLRELEPAFGSFAAFRKQLAQAAVGEFGSGWAWLTLNAMNELQVTSSDDAENPLQRGAIPLLTIDVWEHAYYVDYRNERARYVDAFLDELVNWEFVAENLAAARRRRAESGVEGEGSRTADARYREAASAFAASGRVEPAAREAAREEKRSPGN
jgi:Fe-Mn family superoxide dismutase